MIVFKCALSPLGSLGRASSVKPRNTKLTSARSTAPRTIGRWNVSTRGRTSTLSRLATCGLRTRHPRMQRWKTPSDGAAALSTLEAQTRYILTFFKLLVQWADSPSQTVAAMTTFVLCMVLNPEAQELAQSEIQHVVGHERLPTLDDRKDLPYVDALLKEVLRWAPPAPLGAFVGSPPWASF